MIFEEKTVSTEEKFKGRILRVRLDKVEMPDNTIAEREIVEHPGGVGVVALTEDGGVILVKQYRKAVEKAIYEIPAGKLDKGEEHRKCGLRELEEETGYIPESFVYLGFIYPSPGFTDEKTHLYLAKGLKQGQVHPDEDEYLDVVTLPFEQVLQMVMDGEINDAKTVAGILKAARLR